MEYFDKMNRMVSGEDGGTKEIMKNRSSFIPDPNHLQLAVAVMRSRAWVARAWAVLLGAERSCCSFIYIYNNLII